MGEVWKGTPKETRGAVINEPEVAQWDPLCSKSWIYTTGRAPGDFGLVRLSIGAAVEELTVVFRAVEHEVVSSE